MPEISVTLKRGAGHDAPWVVIKTSSADEAVKVLDEVRQAHLMTRVKQAAQEFSKPLSDTEVLGSYGIPNAPVEAASEPSGLPHQQPAPGPDNPMPEGQAYTPMGEQNLPDSINPTCSECNTPAPFKKGVSAKGTPYEGHYCQNKDCKNYWSEIK